jgi:hypothetical protein
LGYEDDFNVARVVFSTVSVFVVRPLREELVDRLMGFITTYNQDARPFEWT